MSSILNSDNFGQKIYDRFPPKYREDDVGQNYALKRYLQSLSDGGFKHSIDEINGITSLIDPDRVDAGVLPILFRQYGLEVFNGIPENYLRYLLPRLSEAWSKKGSLSVVEFVTSSLSGIKTSTELTQDDAENPTVLVKLEMDYNIGEYFPEASQFVRLLENFVPFYCDVSLMYSYLFYESKVLSTGIRTFDVINTEYNETGVIPNIGQSEIDYSSALLGKAVLGISVLGGFEGEPTEFSIDNMTDTRTEAVTFIGDAPNSFTNNMASTLNSSLFTNALNSYDIITINGTTKVVF